ncbi:MAG: hypothetical protein WC788_05660 [Candidatus Paceibacterota bacterium]
MQNKNPFTASLLNFFFWGMGYIYCGKKHVFGYLVFIAFLFVHLPIMYGRNWTEFPDVFTSIGHIILSIAFAFDVIKPAKVKEQNENKMGINFQS